MWAVFPSPMAPCGRRRGAGRVPIHKLNNTEYDNTVRDLTGVTATMARTFITDETLYGFDNIAEAFGMTDAQFEQYYNAAEAIADQVFASDALRARIMTCTPASAADTACLGQIVGDFGAGAWRRPLGDADTARLVKVATDAVGMGADVTGGVKEVVKTVLASAPFLYRFEFDARPTSTAAHAIDGYELAARLSYLGWSTMPEARLFDLAKSGELLKTDGLSGELDRVMADAKAGAFLTSFAGQWLGMRDLGSHQVDSTIFKDWSEPLRQSMIQEWLSCFNEFLTGTGNGAAGMNQFFSPDVNFFDASLPQLYALPLPFPAPPPPP